MLIATLVLSYVAVERLLGLSFAWINRLTMRLLHGLFIRPVFVYLKKTRDGQPTSFLLLDSITGSPFLTICVLCEIKEKLKLS